MRTARPFVILALLALVASPAARAQTASAWIGCGGSGTTISQRPSKAVVFRPDPASVRRLQSLKPRRLGPFDTARYGFDTIELYLDRSGVDDEGNPTYEIVVRLLGPAPIWLRLEPPVGLTWSPRQSASAPDPVTLPFPGVPIINVSLEHDESRATGGTTLVLDFRPGRPRVPFMMECYWDAILGACGSPDSQLGYVGTGISLGLDASTGDWICSEGNGIDTTWGSHRVSTRRYPLSTGPTDTVRTISDLARAARARARAPKRGEPAPAVEGWGRVEVLRTVETTKGPMLLVGVPERAFTMKAGFLLVPATDGRGETITVDEVRLVDPEPYETEGSEEWTPTVESFPEMPGTPEEAVRFVTSVLESGPPGPLILQVLTEEGEDMFVGRAVYWIGIEETEGRLIASALRIATNTADYAHCGQGYTPTLAVATTVRKQPAFAATLDVEGPNFVNLEGAIDHGTLDEGAAMSAEKRPDFGGGRAQCPRTADVSWTPGAGFAISVQPAVAAPCKPDAKPRLVRIDAHGNLSVAKPSAPR